jgi:hypothetical protein
VDPVLVGLFTFAAGLFLGHRLSLGREKRKEFNEAVQPVRTFFLAESESPSPHRKWPSQSEFDLLLQVMSPWHRRRFLKAQEGFHGAKRSAEVQNELGEVLYSDTKAIKEAAHRVLSCTERR